MGVLIGERRSGMSDIKKLLIIEDDIHFATELKTCLETGSFETKVATNLTDASNLIATWKPDGISLDLQLGGAFSLGLIKHIYNDSMVPVNKPILIVTSAMITAPVITVLNDYQIPYYDKTLKTFKCSLILDIFTLFLRTPTKTQKSSFSVETTANIEDNETLLKEKIEKTLNPFALNQKKIAYSRLVLGIFYTLSPIHQEKHSLANIYQDILDVDYHNAFVGISRLLQDAYHENPAPFYEGYHQRTKEEVAQQKIKAVPTPSDFINYVVKVIKTMS